MENKVTEFLRAEWNALQTRITELNKRLEYVSELLAYAETRENFQKKPKAEDSIYEDMREILLANPGKKFCAQELRILLAPKWENHPNITRGKQDFIKRVWGTVNYLRSRPGIKATKQGRVGYIAWVGEK